MLKGSSARKNAPISRARQRLLLELKRLEQLLEIFQDRSPLVQGSLYRRKYRCGKKGCRCQEGKLHTGLVFSVNQKGRTQLLSLKGVDHEKLEECVKRYRRFRRGRTEAVKIFKRMLREIDRLRDFRKVDLRKV